MGEILCVGHAVEDHVFRVESLPTQPTKHQAAGFEIVGGGPAANAAVAIARLGGRVALAARVGADSVGASIVSDLEREGVDCRLVKRFEGHQSSLSAVMVDGQGQRMIVNYLDPDLPADMRWLGDGFPVSLDGVLADTRWPEGALCAMLKARAFNIPAVLDADHPVPSDGALLRAASHIAFSEQGLTAYAGTDDIEAALIEQSKALEAWCCVTAGGDGVFVGEHGRISHIPVAKVSAIDTLGAGDIWHGAFCLQLAAGQNETEAVNFANATAALKVTRPGGRKGAPSLAEVKTFMKTHAEG